MSLYLSWAWYPRVAYSPMSSGGMTSFARGGKMYLFCCAITGRPPFLVYSNRVLADMDSPSNIKVSSGEVRMSPLNTIVSYNPHCACGKYVIEGELDDWYSDEEIAIQLPGNLCVGDVVDVRGGVVRVIQIIDHKSGVRRQFID